MKNRSTLFSALLRLVPQKWQRVFEHSRMIKYYRVLRRLRKKVFLLGNRGTLIWKKSVPFLFVARVSSLLYLLCLKLERMDWFHTLFYRVGCSLGRQTFTSFLMKVGCPGSLTLPFVLIVGAVITAETESGKMMMAPSGENCDKEVTS